MPRKLLRLLPSWVGRSRKEPEPVKVETPEERAWSLLLSHLTPWQRHCLENYGFFEFKCKREAKWMRRKAFRLYSRAWLEKNQLPQAYSLLPMFSQPGAISRMAQDYYVASRNFSALTDTFSGYLPEGDELLAIKLTLEDNPIHYERACTATFPKSLIKDVSEEEKQFAHAGRE